MGGMVIYRKPSQPLSPVGVEAYILNMLTVAEWRGRGVASAILERLLDCAREKRARGLRGCARLSKAARCTKNSASRRTRATCS